MEIKRTFILVAEKLNCNSVSFCQVHFTRYFFFSSLSLHKCIKRVKYRRYL